MVNLPTGYQLRHLAEVDSTNEEARRLAADNLQIPTWIVANRQTAGRGRRGRDWSSPVGNLMTTLYLPVSLSVTGAGQLAFVAGLALESTVRHLVGDGASVSLKWPNDVLINGAKASGILLEIALREGRTRWVAIGLGLNLTSHPDNAPYPATSIAAVSGRLPDNLQALEFLANAFNTVYRQWQMGGFANVLSAWRCVAHGLGEPITARLENRQLEGIFLDIDEKGALLLQDATGKTHVIDAGDVFFPKMGADG